VVTWLEKGSEESLPGSEVLARYQKSTSLKVIFGVISVAILGLIVVYSISVGSYKIPVSEVVSTIFLKNTSSAVHNVIWNIRIPRILTAIIAGAGLSVAGAAMQSILRNPLGSPYTLGISSAAAFGAAFALSALGAGSVASRTAEAAIIVNNPYLVTVCAFISALSATAVILLLVRYRGATPETMILTGVALGSLFSAGTTALMYFAESMQIAAIVFWQFGDAGKAGWSELAIMTVISLPAVIYFMRNSWNYNSMKAGDETAKSLGVNVERVRIVGMVVASLLTAVIVSFIGIVGFVGLVIPHIVRRFIGGNEMYLIPYSCVTGGLLLLAADTVARTIISPVVLPVGILTSFLGAPLFIYLIIRGREYW
jgi:iron complex transport system permease protein